MADRDPQISFRVTPEVQRQLEELADGQTLYKYMPGFIDDALDSSDKLAEIKRIAKNLEVANDDLIARLFRLEEVERQHQKLTVDFKKLADEYAKAIKDIGGMERVSKALQLECSEHLTKISALESQLKRVIDKAVKNSFVSRKEYEKL